MSGQGYHFAIGADTVKLLLQRQEELEILDVIEGLYAMWDNDLENSAGGYKEWDVLHRCLSDGTFNPSGGTYPLNRCFLGGRLLVTESSIVNLVMPNEVRDVSQGFEHLGEQLFQDRFNRFFAQEYTDGDDLETDCERFWLMIGELRSFYAKAAAEGRAVVFYTDDPLEYFFRSDSL